MTHPSTPALDGPDAIAAIPCLSLRGGRLFVEDCDASVLADRFGTPLYVVSNAQLRANARAFSDALRACWTEGPTHVLASLKANYSLALRRVLTEESVGCDTFGASELRAALACGVDPALISVNGTGKDAGILREAVLAGARVTVAAGGPAARPPPPPPPPPACVSGPATRTSMVGATSSRVRGCPSAMWRSDTSPASRPTTFWRSTGSC
jgi:hypothetical protein